MIASGRVKPWKSTHLQGHFWRTAMGTCSMVLGFYAISMLPLADATALAFSQPLFSVCVAALIVGEKVRWRRWGATIVGFIGVLVMVRPGVGTLQPGAIIALANAAAVAVSILLVKRLSDSETPLMILTQFAIFSTLLLAGPAIWVWRWPDLWPEGHCPPSAQPFPAASPRRVVARGLRYSARGMTGVDSPIEFP